MCIAELKKNNNHETVFCELHKYQQIDKVHI